MFVGEDEKDQMNCIIEVMGMPPRSMIVKANRRRSIFFDDDYRPIPTTDNRGITRKVGSKRLELLMEAGKEEADFVDFIKGCLEWKPEKRLTPQKAFEHDWI